MPTVLLSGGTGMVGQQLTKQLRARGYEVIILTRNIPSSPSADAGIRYACWSVKDQQIDIDAVRAADYVIHLAGAGVVDKRWTPAYKQEILTSRTASAQLLVDTVRQHHLRIKAWVNASAIGWYGPDPVHPPTGWKGFTEEAPAHTDYLGETCAAWEASTYPAEALGIRTVRLRIGIVLSSTGGALAEFVKPIRFGIAGVLGSGNQMISWIGVQDLCRMFIHAMENESMQGSYNAVAPQPVSNRTLTLTLAKHLKGNWFIPMPVPAFVLNIMLGESSIEVLKSTTVSAQKITDTGFQFMAPDIRSCIEAELPR